MMPHAAKLLAGYIFAAACLTAILIGASHRNTSDITDAIGELQAEVQGMDRQWCEAINRMHRVRGIVVLDCERSKIKVEPVE